MTLVLLGDGEERHEIHKISSELDVADKVKIIPPCNPADWYKAADLFCLPSRYEGLGMAAIEAQAAGLKCLLSESVPKEADVTGKCVYLPDDLNAWTEELKKPAPHFYDCKEAIAALALRYRARSAQAGRFLRKSRNRGAAALTAARAPF